MQTIPKTVWINMYDNPITCTVHYSKQDADEANVACTFTRYACLHRPLPDNSLSVNAQDILTSLKLATTALESIVGMDCRGNDSAWKLARDTITTLRLKNHDL